MEKNNIKFIRKNGRIIPIKVKQYGGQDIAAGGALLTAGSIASGLLEKKAMYIRKTANIAKENLASANSFQFDMFNTNLPVRYLKKFDYRKTSKRISDMFKMSSFGYSSSKKILGITRVGSAALLGVGIEKYIRNTRLNEEYGDNASQVAGAAAAIIAERGSSVITRKIVKGEKIAPKIIKGIKAAVRFGVRKRFGI